MVVQMVQVFYVEVKNHTNTSRHKDCKVGLRACNDLLLTYKYVLTYKCVLDLQICYMF